jgi:hypothetical protein
MTNETTRGVAQKQGFDALKMAHKALTPFALAPGAVSLSKALGHIERQHLLDAVQAIEAIQAALAPGNAGAVEADPYTILSDRDLAGVLADLADFDVDEATEAALREAHRRLSAAPLPATQGD